MTTGSVQRRATAPRVAVALLAGCGLLVLGGCEQRAEPRPAYEAAAPPPPAALAGAPDAAPSAAPPPAPLPPDQPPGMEAAPSLAPQDGAPPQPPPAVDEGLVAMAPIPNPEDGGPAPPGSARRYVRHVPAVRPPAAQTPVRRSHRFGHAGPQFAAGARRAHAAPPAKPAAQGPARAQSGPHAGVPTARPTPSAGPAARPAAAPHRERRATPAELRQARRGHGTPAPASPATANTTGADADARTEALRSALSAAVARGAVLSAPKPAADRASDVTLTLPASFYDAVKTEAGKQAMGDAAASANANATLTGEGYAIIPGGPQAQPLRVGQPTAFHWTVTAPAGAKGPLRADVSVDLLGGGTQTLALGAVDGASAGGGAPRWWGAALLAAVVAMGFWWLLRTRSADARIAASRKRAKRPDGTINGQRPLDLRPGDDPPR